MNDVILLHGGVGSDSVLNSKLNGFASSAISVDSLDSVVRAVSMMEDDETFNAGTGSVMRIDGTIQMDASVMVPGKFGAVISIERVRNPIIVAREVMEKSPHVIIAGDGATRFARMMGHEDYDPSTEKARTRLGKVIQELKANPDADMRRELFLLSISDKTHDTVGAVARINGRFAAAVSTGGSSPMMRGRVGDCPIPGSGIFAGDKGAVVATGIGEEIIRRQLCFSIYARMGKEPLQRIMDDEIFRFGDVAVGAIALTSTEIAHSANKDMATGLFRK
ncbi:isoaspartyl peptidase [Thermoplasmatales archaeon]|nr:isoaspartyl peptidase [Thermoplasmatales archaeon]